MELQTIVCWDGEVTINKKAFTKLLPLFECKHDAEDEEKNKAYFKLPYCTTEVISALSKVVNDIFLVESTFSKLGVEKIYLKSDLVTRTFNTTSVINSIKKTILCNFFTNNIELVHNIILTAILFDFDELINFWIADTKQKLTCTERNETYLYNLICGINDINQDVIYDLFYEISAIHYSSLKKKYPKFEDILDPMDDRPEKICQKYETEDSPFLIIINQNREDVVKYILDNLGEKTIYDQKKYDPYRRYVCDAEGGRSGPMRMRSNITPFLYALDIKIFNICDLFLKYDSNLINQMALEEPIDVIYGMKTDHPLQYITAISLYILYIDDCVNDYRFEYLLKNGVDLNVHKDNNGNILLRPIEAAILTKKVVLLPILLKHGADSNNVFNVPF